MSDPWGTADCAPSDRLAAVQQRIQQVAAVGVEIVNQLVAPANGALKKLNGARTRITKQLLSPAAEEMAQLEHAAQQIADNSALQYQAPAAQAVEVIVDNRGRQSAGEDNRRPDPTDPNAVFAWMFREDRTPEHQRAIAWAGQWLADLEAMPSLAALIASRNAGRAPGAPADASINDIY